MASRKQATARAIAESVELSQGGKPKEKDPPPKPRGQCNAGLYVSWGASDLHKFFRFRSSVLGLKAQVIAPQAETIGKRPLPFWDEANAAAVRNPQKESSRLVKMQKAVTLKVDRARAKYERLPLAENLAALTHAERTLGAVELALEASADNAPRALDAMPTAGREVRSVSSPDAKVTDDSIDAVTDLRRIEAGVARVDGMSLVMLEILFSPPRLHPQIEAIFQELGHLIVNFDPVVREAHEEAMESRKRRLNIDAWLVERLDQEESKRQFRMDGWRDKLIDDAVARAEERGLAAIRAYEEVTAQPPEVREESERGDRASVERRRKRTPKASRVNLGFDAVPESASVARAAALQALDEVPS